MTDNTPDPRPEPDPKKADSKQADSKQERLAAALRANLRRRKAQGREQATEAEEGSDRPPPSPRT